MLFFGKNEFLNSLGVGGPNDEIDIFGELWAICDQYQFNPHYSPFVITNSMITYIQGCLLGAVFYTALRNSESLPILTVCVLLEISIAYFGKFFV